MTTSLVRYFSTHGGRVLAWVAAGCIGIAILWPDQTLAERATVLGYGLVAIAMTYGFFRLFLVGIAWLGELFLGRVSYWYILFILYAGAISVPLALLTLPFQWKDLYVDGMTGPMVLASIPSGLSLALAAARVINEKYVEV